MAAVSAVEIYIPLGGQRFECCRVLLDRSLLLCCRCGRVLCSKSDAWEKDVGAGAVEAAAVFLVASRWLGS